MDLRHVYDPTRLALLAAGPLVAVAGVWLTPTAGDPGADPAGLLFALQLVGFGAALVVLGFALPAGTWSAPAGPLAGRSPLSRAGAAALVVVAIGAVGGRLAVVAGAHPSVGFVASGGTVAGAVLAVAIVGCWRIAGTVLDHIDEGA